LLGKSAIVSTLRGRPNRKNRRTSVTAIPVRAMRNRDLNIIPIVPPPLLMQSECHGELDQRSGLVQKALINTTPALRATPPRLRRVFGSSSDSTCKAFHAGDHHSCLDQFVQPLNLKKESYPIR